MPMKGGEGAALQNFKVVIALATGGALGSLTLAASKLSAISDNSIAGTVQRVLFRLLLPGMIGAEAFSGNAHAWSLWIAAGINALIYFLLGWVAYSVLTSLFRKMSN